MDLATEVYIHHCKQTPFGTAVINLFKGASSEKAQNMVEIRLVCCRKQIQTFTAILRWLRIYRKDMKLMLAVLGKMFLVLFIVMKTIVHIQCLLKTNLKGGAPVTFFPWPFKDPLYPYEQKDCETCSWFCTGYYLKVEDVYKLFKNGETLPKEPPSIMIKNEFKNSLLCVNNGDNIEILSESTPIPPHETKLHLKHCEAAAMNRKLGVAKTAKTLETIEK